MLNQQTMSILHSLKLFGMAKGLEERSANTQHAELRVPKKSSFVRCKKGNFREPEYIK